MADGWEKAKRFDLVFKWVWPGIQRAWSWLVPTVSGLVASWLGGLERLPLSTLFLLGLYGVAGGLCLVGAAHWLYRRLAHASVTAQAEPQVTILNAFPVVVSNGTAMPLVEWRNENAEGEGGRVDLIDGSIHVTLRNRSGHDKSQLRRPVRLA